jgi:hypothetical protein
MALIVVSGCGSGGNNGTDNRSTPVCDGKLSGDVFQTLAGSGGVVSEKTTRFHPKKWTAYGDCQLNGKKDFVVIGYLWYSVGTTKLNRVKSPSPTTVKTFKVGSATGYVEKSRARVVIPCAIPGSYTSNDALLEVEVKNPFRPVDSKQRDAFASAATIAARYLGGEVFACPAVQSGASSGSSSSSPSNG